MIKKIGTILIAIVLLTYFFGIMPKSALADFTGVDGFETGYTNGVSVDDVNGGSGFAAWGATSGKYKGDSSVGNTGTWSMKYSTMLDADAQTTRVLSSDSTSGVFRIAIRRDDGTNGRTTVGIRGTTNVREWFIRMRGADLVQDITYNDVQTPLASWTNNQWYIIDIKYDTSVPQAQIRVYAAGSTCPSYGTNISPETNDGAVHSIGINTSTDASGSAWFDDLGDGATCYPAASTGTGDQPQAEVVWFATEI